MLVANNAQIRLADKVMVDEYGMPSLLLMETAGRLSANKLRELYPDIRNFLILCGGGNNGGDGLVVARYLHQAGLRVWVVNTGEKNGPPDYAANLRIVSKMGIAVTPYEPSIKDTLDHFLQGGTVIVDAMIGTGFNGVLRESTQEVISMISGLRNDKVALEMPSGLNGDTGAVTSRPIRCAHTLTFQLPKICHYVTPAAMYCGKVHVIDIGIYPQVIDKTGIKVHLMDDTLTRKWYKPRKTDGHKGTYGHALVAGGSKGMSGAIAMSASGAVEIGVGLCTAFIPGAITCSFHRNTLENMSIPYGTERTSHLNSTAAEVMGTYLEGKNAIAIGPGLGLNEDTRGFLHAILEKLEPSLPLLLDADALNILAEDDTLWKYLGKNTVITPHPGEMARLLNVETNEIQQNRLEFALKLATKRNVTVVLKGAGTVIASPDGSAYFCNAGNPGMGTGGMGDVLTGAIVGLLAQGYAPVRAAAMGVYVHATTGDRLETIYGQEGITAVKLMRNMGRAWREILTGEKNEKW